MGGSAATRACPLAVVIAYLLRAKAQHGLRGCGGSTPRKRRNRPKSKIEFAEKDEKLRQLLLLLRHREDGKMPSEPPTPSSGNSSPTSLCPHLTFFDL